MLFQAAGPLIFVAIFAVVNALNNGLAITPQMGWDNWNSFECAVSEALLLQTSQLIVDLGLKDLGYQYVILDDCWSAGRNTSNDNSLIPDPDKFPNGMKAVADAIHALGLKYGMYSSAGSMTCGRFAGSLGYETIDAETWAAWGVDYLKYDNCYNEGQAGTQFLSYTRYNVMSKALNATGRPILYSLCNWGEDYPWDFGPTIANSFRITGDVWDNWDRYDPLCPCKGDDAYNCQQAGKQCSIMNIANKAAFVAYKPRKGSWNDLDMLEVGNGAMTDAEYVAHFSLWAAAKSPLIMGNDLRVIKPADLSILSNAAVIAVNQDPLGSSATRVWFDASTNSQLWVGDLQSTTNSTVNDCLVLFINGLDTPDAMEASLSEIFAPKSLTGRVGVASQVSQSWEVRDLWANRMSDEEAQEIINPSGVPGSATNGHNTTSVGGARYNATASAYAQGLVSANEILLGRMTTVLKAQGTLKVSVDAHGAAMFRLRVLNKGLTKKDEL